MVSMCFFEFGSLSSARPHISKKVAKQEMPSQAAPLVKAYNGANDSEGQTFSHGMSSWDTGDQRPSSNAMSLHLSRLCIRRSFRTLIAFG